MSSIPKKRICPKGDVKFCILHLDKTKLESINNVCNYRRLGPNSTIRKLLTSNESFSVGSISIIVIIYEQNNYQYELTIKNEKNNI